MGPSAATISVKIERATGSGVSGAARSNLRYGYVNADVDWQAFA
jgi:hypothetical protein